MLQSVKNKKALELKNKIQIHIAKLNAVIREKKNFRANQIYSLQKKYMAKAPDLTPQFENVIRSDICIEKANEALNYLQVLFRNTDLLVDSKKLPDDIKHALEYCFYFSQVDKQKDLYNFLKDIDKIHKSKKHPRTTHETKVLFSYEQVTMEDATKYYPTIKNECNLIEDLYLFDALQKYKNIFQSSQQQTLTQYIQPNTTQFIQIPQQNLGQLQQFAPQTSPFDIGNLNQFQLLTPQNLTQPPQFTTQNLSQPPQFNTQNLGLPPQFSPQNPPQFNTQNLGQPPTFIPQDLNQPPQFNFQNPTQLSQLNTQNLGQLPQFIPQNLNQPPNFTPQN